MSTYSRFLLFCLDRQFLLELFSVNFINENITFILLECPLFIHFYTPRIYFPFLNALFSFNSSQAHFQVYLQGCFNCILISFIDIYNKYIKKQILEQYKSERKILPFILFQGESDLKQCSSFYWNPFMNYETV